MLKGCSEKNGLFCVPCILHTFRVRVPNEPIWQESLADRKGVLREEESEGSVKQNVDMTDRNMI